MGEELENVTQNFVLPSTDISRDGEALLVQPWANVEKCTKCGICKKRCPVKAITLSPYPVSATLLISCQGILALGGLLPFFKVQRSKKGRKKKEEVVISS